MPYKPTIWQTGDVITAEKLNHIENGVDAASFPEATKEALTSSVGNCFVVHVVETEDGYETVETCAEIFAAQIDGKQLYIPELCPVWLCTAFVQEVLQPRGLYMEVRAQVVYVDLEGCYIECLCYKTELVAEADLATSKFVIPYEPTKVYTTTLSEAQEGGGVGPVI